MLALKKPQRILEVGTAVGFSTLLMCEYCQPEICISQRLKIMKKESYGRENFKKQESQITFLEGDAGDSEKELAGSYDLIFMDAAKGQYIHWFPDVLRLLAPEGVLVSDNVLQEGDD